MFQKRVILWKQGILCRTGKYGVYEVLSLLWKGMAATNHAGKAVVARAQPNLEDLCDQERLRSAFATVQSNWSLCSFFYSLWAYQTARSSFWLDKLHALYCVCWSSRRFRHALAQSISMHFVENEIFLLIYSKVHFKV